MYLLEDSPEGEAMRENVCNLLATGDESNALLAYQLIKAGGHHRVFAPYIIAHSCNEAWSYEYYDEENPKPRIFTPLIGKVLEEKEATALKRMLKNSYAWYDFAPKLIKRVQSKPDDFLVPYWKQILILGSHWDDGIDWLCWRHKLIDGVEFLQRHINVYTSNASLYLNNQELEDIPDEIGSLQITYLNLYNNPLTKVRLKKWVNLYVEDCSFDKDLLSQSARKVIGKCFPTFLNKVLYKKQFEELISTGFLKCTPKEQRDIKFYKECAQCYKQEGNYAMAMKCYLYLDKTYPYPEEVFKFKIAECYALLRNLPKTLEYLQLYTQETPYNVRKDIRCSRDFAYCAKKRDFQKWWKDLPVEPS